MKIIRSLAVFSGLVISASAGATTWGDDINTPGFNTVAAGAPILGSIFCSTTLCNTTGTGLGSGPVITMKAYSTQGPAAAQTGANPAESNGGGAWIAAKIQLNTFGSHVGVGITNTVEPDPTAPTSPEAAIDNNGVDDILVVDFGSTGSWDVNSFSVGYTCNASTLTCGSAVDISAWVTNTLPTGFSGNNATAAPNVAYTALTFTNDPSSSIGQRAVTSGDTAGRYLIIAGNPNTFADAFTIKGISANQVSGPSGQTPVPGSLPLAAVALLALAWTSRRRRAVPIRGR